MVFDMLALRIHMSKECKYAIQRITGGSYDVTARAEITIKVSGIIRRYEVRSWWEINVEVNIIDAHDIIIYYIDDASYGHVM